MSLVVGVAGVERNASVAIVETGQILAICEQERITRTRRAGMPGGRAPLEALHAALRAVDRSLDDVASFATAEAGVDLDGGTPMVRVDHHAAHAATAFYTSPFDDAVVMICDRRGSAQLSVWSAQGATLTQLDYPWLGPAFADIYSAAARAFDFGGDGIESRLEALAQAGAPEAAPDFLIRQGAGRLEISAGFEDALAKRVAEARRSRDLAPVAGIAAGFQAQLGDGLIACVQDIVRKFGGRHLCLGGGLFYNSYLTTRIAESAVYEGVFVPVNPGNAGSSAGAALLVSAHAEGRRPALGTSPVSPFLGPGYATTEIKATLDNCKLSYDYLGERGAIERAASELARGKLVGWFQGRMEWGPRALGHRSIFASPVSPFVLENLNGFLKHREPHRTYSVAVPAERVSEFFKGPARSDFMEFEYEVRDRDLLRGLLPLHATRLRVQTVPASSAVFHALLTAFGAVSGVPVLVNTSFNGFNEPIVCSPRDAVRVFYGTGLDIAMIGNFILHK